MDDPTKDTIPRSAVEYCLRKETVSTNPEKYKTHEKFIDYMNDPDISEFGHWMHSNGFNCALTAISVNLRKIPSITPPAQSEPKSYRMGYQAGYEAAQRWIPVTERLPENEQEVFVTVEVRPFGRKPFRRVVRAFYTDGKHTDADSAYSWNDFPNPQYDDKDNLIIPEGWWESSDYSEQQGMIDDFVVAWREPLEPWEEEKAEGAATP